MTYLVTGGAGFIGSNVVGYLNSFGLENIIIVDKLDYSTKWKNLVGKKYVKYIDKDVFFSDVSNIFDHYRIDTVIHMGAISNTLEFSCNELMDNNTKNTYSLYLICRDYDIPLIYASSAATYGGSTEFNDDNFNLAPLNMYGYSKHLLDEWIIRDTNNFTDGTSVVGLKFFNVYGPGEAHKGNMASVAYKAFNKIQYSKTYELYDDGNQKRDFIYINDIVSVIDFFMNGGKSGIYNVGTGIARTFNDMVNCVFNELEIKPDVSYVKMPNELRSQYQYFTQANIDKLRSVGYTNSFYSLEDGIKDYVKILLKK